MTLAKHKIRNPSTDHSHPNPKPALLLDQFTCPPYINRSNLRPGRYTKEKKKSCDREKGAYETCAVQRAKTSLRHKRFFGLAPKCKQQKRRLPTFVFYDLSSTRLLTDLFRLGSRRKRIFPADENLRYRKLRRNRGKPKQFMREKRSGGDIEPLC